MASLRVSAVCAWPLWSRLLSLQIGEPEMQGKGLFTDEASSPLLSGSRLPEWWGSHLGLARRGACALAAVQPLDDARVAFHHRHRGASVPRGPRSL